MIFNSPLGWFSLRLPDNWAEYDSEEEGTCAFFNTDIWTGNLRITPVRNSSDKSDMADSLLSSTLQKYSNSAQIKLGKRPAVKFMEELIDADGAWAIHYWYVGEKETVFICSFTSHLQNATSPADLKEIEIVEEILSTITITENHA